jgi:hypothetical protein
VVLGLDPSRLAEIPARLRHPRRNVVPPLWDGMAGHRAAVAIEQFVHAGAPVGAAAHAAARRRGFRRLLPALSPAS